MINQKRNFKEEDVINKINIITVPIIRRRVRQ